MIDKVGGVILKDKKILVQRKNNNREECIILGVQGKGKKQILNFKERITRRIK